MKESQNYEIECDIGMQTARRALHTLAKGAPEFLVLPDRVCCAECNIMTLGVGAPRRAHALQDAKAA